MTILKLGVTVTDQREIIFNYILLTKASWT